ncbi:MAG: hypothetical protein CMJ90_06805 [Planctomycetes bacterium]|nr:hypothetical protein [Planctomycetota bacterium]
MLHKTATTTALLLTVLSLTLTAQTPSGQARLSIHGAEEIDADKALVLSGSLLKLEIQSDYAQAYVAFTYEVGGGWNAFAANLTDDDGALVQLMQVPASLDSGTLKVQAFVFDRSGDPIQTNSFLVTFRPSETKGRDYEASRHGYSLMPLDMMGYAAKAKKKKKAQAQAQAAAQDYAQDLVGGRGRGRVASTSNSAAKKKAKKKAQAQDYAQDLVGGRGRVAPTSNSAAKKKAKKKGQAQDLAQDTLR